jgi:hypothetical protein
VERHGWDDSFYLLGPTLGQILWNSRGDDEAVGPTADQPILYGWAENEPVPKSEKRFQGAAT